MIAIWYGVLSFMLMMYVILDGRNFGVGILHWMVARTPEERRQVVAAIGPLWTWHEVWLVGFGGTLVAIFPRLMASAFAGYYLALFLILWCLILRGISLEVGGHIQDRLWQTFWDFVFSVSSLLLAMLFGVAAGNLARGVPIDADGNFTMAFFTHFDVHGYVGLLDWYTVSVAIFAAVILAAHGANYLTLKTEGTVHDRSAACARWLWWAVAALFVVISAETWFVRPELFGQALVRPYCWLGWTLIAVSGAGLISGLVTRNELRASIASGGLLGGLLVTGAADLYPVLLFSTLTPEDSMTVQQAAAHQNALLYAAMWWPMGLVLTTVYFIVVSRRYLGKISEQRDAQSLY